MSIESTTSSFDHCPPANPCTADEPKPGGGGGVVVIGGGGGTSDPAILEKLCDIYDALAGDCDDTGGGTGGGDDCCVDGVDLEIDDDGVLTVTVTNSDGDTFTDSIPLTAPECDFEEIIDEYEPGLPSTGGGGGVDCDLVSSLGDYVPGMPPTNGGSQECDLSASLSDYEPGPPPVGGGSVDCDPVGLISGYVPGPLGSGAGSVECDPADTLGAYTPGPTPKPPSTNCTQAGPLGLTAEPVGDQFFGCQTPSTQLTDPETAGFTAASFPTNWQQTFADGVTGEEIWIVLLDTNGVKQWHQIA